jgi:hypothetical protein
MKHDEIMSVLGQVHKIWQRHKDGRPGERSLTALDRQSNLARLPWHTQIVGYGVGTKLRQGKAVGGEALRLYVRRKVAPNRLLKQDRIPKRAYFRPLKKYLPTDVIEQSRPFFAQAALQAGSAVAHVSGPAGLIATAVLDNDDNSTLLLSCAHIFAPRNHMDSNVIESPPAPGSTIINRIGVLDTFSQFSAQSTIDAATCTPDPGVTIPVAQVNGQRLAGIWDPDTNPAPLPERRVWRIDQNGKRVDGVIAGVDSQDVSYFDGFPPVHFQGVIRYTAPNQAGDSGGAVVDTLTNQLLGVHFAGDSGTQSLFCLASLVFPALGIKLS